MLLQHAIQDLMPKFSLEYWNIVEKIPIIGHLENDLTL